MPPPTYILTIVISNNSSSNSDREVIKLPQEVHCIVDHMTHQAHPYQHTRSSLPATAPYTRRERCLMCSQTHQPPTAQDLLAITEIAS